MEKERRKEHVIIFPFMAQGHVIPFMALAMEIERRFKYKISFISTPLNVQKLKTSLSRSSSIRLRSIPFDSTAHGLPPNTENSDGLPVNLLYRLMNASFDMEPDVRTLLQEILEEDNDHPPLCIITDIFFAWVGRVARELNSVHAIFAANDGFGLACYHSLWSNIPNWKVEGAQEFDMEDFPEGGKIHIAKLPKTLIAADGSDPWSVFHLRMLGEWLNADCFLYNTVEKIDHMGLEYFRRKLRIPVWAIGPILNKERVDAKYGISREECKAWLDSKPPKSVLYVCFGSQNTLTSLQIVEMARALEGCGRFFIWVVRPPLDEFESEAYWRLPQGFEERVCGRGLIVNKWAPQVDILSHVSIGGFISHCGWNSTLEAISYGVPIIAWPMGAEQFFNVKHLMELGVCVEFSNEADGQEDVMRKIEMVMGEDEGALEVKRRVCDISKMIANATGDQHGSSLRAINDFFTTAVVTRRQRMLQKSSGSWFNNNNNKVE